MLPDIWTFLKKSVFHVKFTTRKKKKWLAKQSRSVRVLTGIWLFETPVAHQAPLVHGILQARILDWVAISSSRGSFQSRDQIRVWSLHCRYVSCIAGGFFTSGIRRKPQSRSVDRQFSVHVMPESILRCSDPGPFHQLCINIWLVLWGRVLLPAGLLIHLVGLAFFKVVERSSQEETMALLPGRWLCPERWAPGNQTLSFLILSSMPYPPSHQAWENQGTQTDRRTNPWPCPVHPQFLSSGKLPVTETRKEGDGKYSCLGLICENWAQRTCLLRHPPWRAVGKQLGAVLATAPAIQRHKVDCTIKARKSGSKNITWTKPLRTFCIH